MLNWNTVDSRLKNTLIASMSAEEFKDFRLVGGTALSLQLGHRMSEDIDLFTDAAYGSIDFQAIENYLVKTYPYVEGDFNIFPGMCKSYLIGDDRINNIKLDVFYSMDPFFQPIVIEEHIRMASVEEIIAMKLDIIKRDGRKKDFWDLHELLGSYTISELIALHAARFEWTHDPDLIRSQFANFERAEYEINPKCLRGKLWEFIKRDFLDALNRDRPGPAFTR
ncbi:MAG: nucleotidyl transferase AbiEii/AbiGii toxin family protein [Bacteroidota bacterium]|nr:nucleotidyl transferase AbiEii/AbiGii toxin family protein [Bacteroidota bacterium]